MKNRSELFSNFRAFCAKIHTQFHVYVQNLRTDNAKEYLSEQFHSCFRMTSFIRHLVLILLKMELLKKKNRHLLETARAILFQMHVSKHFLADVSITCFFINRMSSSVLD